LELLSNPGKTSRYYICCALKTAADKSAIPFVRPMLKVDDMQTVVEAAEALGAMGDKESFDSIAALLPKLKPERSSMDVLRMDSLLRVLAQMNGQSAEPIINRYFADPAWAELLKDFKWSIYHPAH
jgi:HEAT repeat protein